MNEKSLLLAIKGLPSKRIPVWFLRQAGRYLPEYREIRKEYEFLDLCKNSKLASEITLQPLKRFDLDAAIIFSDILIPATALGQNLTFAKDHGPLLSNPVRDQISLSHLDFLHYKEKWNFVGDAISRTKSKLLPHQTMIGFAGAPFTLASYMIEGKGGTNFSETKKLAFQNQDLLKTFLMKLAEMTLHYLQMQIEAGAEVLMLFDTWAQQIHASAFRKLVKPATDFLIAEISKSAPIIYYSGQGSDRLYDLENTKASALAIDWRTTLSHAKKITSNLGLNTCFQGNLDPLILTGNEDYIRNSVREILNEAKHCELPGYIFNVGHGLLPQTPIEAIEWAIDEVRTFQNS